MITFLITITFKIYFKQSIFNLYLTLDQRYSLCSSTALVIVNESATDCGFIYVSQESDMFSILNVFIYYYFIKYIPKVDTNVYPTIIITNNKP